MSEQKGLLKMLNIADLSDGVVEDDCLTCDKCKIRSIWCMCHSNSAWHNRSLVRELQEVITTLGNKDLFCPDAVAHSDRELSMRLINVLIEIEDSGKSMSEILESFKENHESFEVINN